MPTFKKATVQDMRQWLLVNVTQEQLKADGDFAVLTKGKELIWGLTSEVPDQIQQH